MDKFEVDENTGTQTVSIRDQEINKQLEQGGLTSGSWDTNIVVIESKEDFDSGLKFESSGSGGGYDTIDKRYGVELSINQTNNQVIIDKVSIAESKQGEHGKSGIGYNFANTTELSKKQIF